MSQDNRLMSLPPGTAPLDRPLRELTHPERPNNTYNAAEPTHLRDYIQIVLKRKWLILSLAVVVTSLAAIQAYRQPSIYEAQTTIQIEQKSKNLIKTKELILNAGTDPTFWATQLKLLENPRLARKVILRLGLHNDPAFTGAQERPGLLGALRRAVSGQQPKKNEKSGGGGLSVVNDASTAGPQGDDAQLTSEQEARMEALENALRSGLLISPVKDTSLIDIRFQHSDPALAMRITDAVADVFIRENFDRESSGAREAAQQLAQRIIDLQIELKKQQDAELRFKQANDLPLGPVQGQNLAALQLTTYSSQMMDAEAKYKAMQSEWERVQESLQQPGVSILSIPTVQADKYIQDIQTKIENLEEQRAALLTTYTEKHPAVVRLDEQRRNLERAKERRAHDAVKALGNQYESAKSNAEKMRRNYEQARTKVNYQGIAATKLQNLQAELETTKQMYNTHLAKQKEVELSPHEASSNITVATPARTPALIGPPRVRNILIALVLSLAAGIGLAFLLDYLDDTLKSIEDVDRHIHLPTLALVPAPRTERRLLGRGSPAAPAEPTTALALIEDVRSPVTEAYRHLRTSLLLSSAGQPPRTVLVTSSQPSEGKTTTAVNTALMLAQTGADVLLIDCDLRRPRVHGHFEMANARGVTNYLSGEFDIDSLMQTYEKLPNLKVITSGPVPPNAAELLGSEQMRRLLEALSERFQHVIIDSPPAISFTDASILSTMVDGVMLVVHGGRSSRAVVRRAKQQLLDVGAHIFGIVLNNVVPDSSNSYYYYYASYYSGYYAEDDDANGDGDGIEVAGAGATTKRV
ncbi:MAG TPA: polysaccharide biosynthesis tyrosine autokinase [Pyrinomonadaceae bacterium]|nr:polysaccharide biosynthesis tyrosine autokinase [Pyrinomonadaceae bacterium]